MENRSQACKGHCLLWKLLVFWPRTKSSHKYIRSLIYLPAINCFFIQHRDINRWRPKFYLNLLGVNHPNRLYHCLFSRFITLLSLAKHTHRDKQILVRTNLTNSCPVLIHPKYNLLLHGHPGSQKLCQIRTSLPVPIGTSGPDKISVIPEIVLNRLQTHTTHILPLRRKAFEMQPSGPPYCFLKLFEDQCKSFNHYYSTHLSSQKERNFLS